ncbi:MAG: RagB/SusD family nutrient uptake outer membrane protein [Zunongwangia sp.]|uniref:RagB/SusD family nutrient uptake outer membrane protein n=1 Tax=Zunongwangia sp. TaxID=1965325 RepID=UPI003242F1CE
MKTKKISVAIGILLIMFNISCTELYDDSYGSVVSENFNPESEDDISALVNAAYVPWRKIMLLWNGVVRAQELSADQDVIPARIGIGWIDGYIYKRWHQHTWTTNDDSVYQSWSRTFEGINTVNRLLYQIDQGVIVLPDGDTQNALISELKVLRASYYYILVDLYGNVPIVTDYSDTSLPQQSKRSEVFDFIIEEITNNIDNLSEEARGYYYGRMNKWVAHTLLAKMYLNAEVWKGEAMWQKCIEECNAVMASGNYNLEANQKNVFITENQDSREIIFALPMDEKYVTDWNAFDFHMYTLAQENQQTYDMAYAPWGGVCATPQFIDSFNPNDKRLKENYIKGQQYALSGEELSINYTNSVPSIDESDKDDGYRWGKFEYKIGSTNRLGNDFPVFRYADILLMKAEALMRSGQSGAGELVSEVRIRDFDSAQEATVTDAELSMGSNYDYGRRDSYSQTFEGGSNITYGRFLDELGWEFCQEGRRRQDLIRFGVFTTKSWFSHDASDINKQLYPIPYDVMLTNSNLKQNPGYSE